MAGGQGGGFQYHQEMVERGTDVEEDWDSHQGVGMGPFDGEAGEN